ncbi:RNA polymerase sigma factor [Sphaerisporangium corydalis]|uniref:RNA polymerase sigma factor n=1 Tax=Sphaerisporangium corydalis TaxID=1441875 RepID=A0ABV9EQX1_9ACTN|nr:sigma-70 family RNA polymerase sigma factor [Sphaerisporangium corydalis]
MSDEPAPECPTPSLTDRGPERRDRLAAQLRRAQEGHGEALDAVVADLTPMLWHAVRSQGLGRQAAEDVIQTTWLSLLRYLHTIENPAGLIEWLITTARREAWRVRAASRAEDLADDDALARVPDPGVPPDDLVVQDEQGRALWKAVARLAQPCRDLLRIVAFVRRPDYDAVAAALGMPRGSIGPTRGRCLTKLRRLLAEDPDWSRS